VTAFDSDQSNGVVRIGQNWLEVMKQNAETGNLQMPKCPTSVELISMASA
jgi:hypothetical protein